MDHPIGRDDLSQDISYIPVESINPGFVFLDKRPNSVLEFVGLQNPKLGGSADIMIVKGKVNKLEYFIKKLKAQFQQTSDMGDTKKKWWQFIQKHFWQIFRYINYLLSLLIIYKKGVNSGCYTIKNLFI